jgi:glyoxylase-like metal-dependent hydrolase (beta-lactamase superfamily II)
VLQRNVAPGVHRVEDAHTNWYLIEDEGRVTIVDAGVPRSWASFLSAMGELGHPLSAVAALVLTHAHFDHLGFAERARVELDVPVYVHSNDVPLTRHPRQYAHERARSYYVATQPRALPYVVGFALARARSSRCRCAWSSASRTARWRSLAHRASSSPRGTRSATARCTCPTATW